MRKIRLTKPFPQPQYGKCIPAGVIMDDAPEPLMEKLVRQGRAVWADETEAAPEETIAEATPEETEKRARRKRRAEGE